MTNQTQQDGDGQGNANPTPVQVNTINYAKQNKADASEGQMTSITHPGLWAQNRTVHAFTLNGSDGYWKSLPDQAFIITQIIYSEKATIFEQSTDGKVVGWEFQFQKSPKADGASVSINFGDPGSFHPGAGIRLRPNRLLRATSSDPVFVMGYQMPV